MLVLSRHVNESIILSDPEGRRVVVTVVRLQGDKVRLGFEAPDDVVIHRDEVQDAIDHRAASSRPARVKPTTPPRGTPPQSAGNGPSCDPPPEIAPRDVPCPVCGRAAGEPCDSDMGGGWYHRERADLAEIRTLGEIARRSAPRPASAPRPGEPGYVPLRQRGGRA